MFHRSEDIEYELLKIIDKTRDHAGSLTHYSSEILSITIPSEIHNLAKQYESLWYKILRALKLRKPHYYRSRIHRDDVPF
jgi:hypothetical protein